MAEYIKKQDVVNAMEENSFIIDFYGSKKKVVDAMMICCSIADMETEKIEDYGMEGAE